MFSFIRQIYNKENTDFYIPHRYREGYGISQAGVEYAVREGYTLVIALDCGIKSIDLISYALAQGVEFIVCDHHLPGDSLPDAAALVNPNLPGDAFPSKALAGVGVVFYLLLALRARLRADGGFAGRAEPDLSVLLDLVALGTVADLVPLDYNNRVLVDAGLRRIRAGQACAGV